MITTKEFLEFSRRLEKLENENSRVKELENEISRLKELENENSRLKVICARHNLEMGEASDALDPISPQDHQRPNFLRQVRSALVSFDQQQNDVNFPQGMSTIRP